VFECAFVACALNVCINFRLVVRHVISRRFRNGRCVGNECKYELMCEVRIRVF